MPDDAVTDDQPDGLPETGNAPPGECAPPAPAVTSRWPVLLGIGAILFSGLNLTAAIGSCGQAGWAIHATDPNVDPEITIVFSLVVMVSNLPAGLVQLLGGALLRRRRRRGQTLLLVYCGIQLAAIVAVTGAQVWSLYRMSPEWLPPPLPVLLIASAFRSILPLAWVMFLLAWLLRPSVRQEVAAWPE
jgi:hypothetical protein